MSPEPGDGSEVHARTQPGPNVVEVPVDRRPKASSRLSFKEQVVGVCATFQLFAMRLLDDGLNRCSKGMETC